MESIKKYVSMLRSSSIDMKRMFAAILNGSLQQAMRNGLIERNPVKLAELSRTGEKKAKQAMTREQQDLFMEYAKKSYLYNLFAVMLRIDMRNGEIRGLKYMDIGRKKNVLHVQRTLKYIEIIGRAEEVLEF